MMGTDGEGRSGSLASVVALLVAATTVSWQNPVLGAGAGEVDGAYGRLDGDLSLAAQVGVSEMFPGELLSARLGCHYLHTVGLYVQYDDALGSHAPRLARSVGFGVEVRPLFLPRFASDLEQGPAWLDLWADSLGLDLGVVAAALPAEECADPSQPCWSPGLQLGFGMELPLLARAEGPFIGLRGALRWPTPTEALGSEQDRGPLGRPSTTLSLRLGYRLLLAAHLVDAGDRRD
jgi:hypothetical protein